MGQTVESETFLECVKYILSSATIQIHRAYDFDKSRYNVGASVVDACDIDSRIKVRVWVTMVSLTKMACEPFYVRSTREFSVRNEMNPTRELCERYKDEIFMECIRNINSMLLDMKGHFGDLIKEAESVEAGIMEYWKAGRHIEIDHTGVG